MPNTNQLPSSTFVSPETGSSYVVNLGGSVSGTVSDTYGAQTVLSGVQTVSSGAAVSGTTITGTNQNVLTGPAFEIVPVAVAAVQTVLSGGAALNTIVSGTDNRATTPQASASQILQSGAYASATTLGVNGFSVAQGGAFADAVTIAGGRQTVSSGGILNGATITSGGVLDLEGGSATNVVASDVSAGNPVTIIDNGGRLTHATIGSGVSLSMGSNTFAQEITVASGGRIVLENGARLLGTNQLDSGAVLSLAAAGNDLSQIRGQVIADGGTVTQGTTQARPLLEIFSGNTLINTIALPYDTTPYQFVATPNGGIALVTNFALSQAPSFIAPETGSSYNVYAGGVISGDFLPSPPSNPAPPLDLGQTNNIQTVSSGMAASGTTLQPVPRSIGGSYRNVSATSPMQTVLSGGAALETTLEGCSYIPGGGTLGGQSYVKGSATQILSSGAYASNTTLRGLGSSIVSSGAITNNVTIAGNRMIYGPVLGAMDFTFGGTQIVSSGGILNGASITSGGVLDLEGGSASNVSTINDFFFSPYSSLYPGPAVRNATIIDNGGVLTNVSLGDGSLLAIGANTAVTTLSASSAASIILGRGASLLGKVTLDPHTTILLQAANGPNSELSGRVVSTPFSDRVQSHNGASLLEESALETPVQEPFADKGQSILEVLSGNTVINRIALSSATTPFSFVNAPSGNGVDLIVGTPCYCPGTLIATPGGERPVETLAIGDLIQTADGTARPIHWIGQRAYDPVFAFGNRDILPVRFQAGSLGNGLPRRDLTVSPLHAMFIDGYLIPALHLVNGHSIRQLSRPSEIRYIHIELESHDLLMAEGAPSESFIDDGSRGMFHNASDYATRYGDHPPVPARYCAPRLESGPELARIQQNLNTFETNETTVEASTVFGEERAA